MTKQEKINHLLEKYNQNPVKTGKMILDSILRFEDTTSIQVSKEAKQDLIDTVQTLAFDGMMTMSEEALDVLINPEEHQDLVPSALEELNKVYTLLYKKGIELGEAWVTKHLDQKSLVA